MLEYTGQFGLAGSLVGAILQAAGLISLNSLIVQAEYYFRAIGVLFFVASVIIIITKLATGSNLRQALLLLLGPLLGLTALFTIYPVVIDKRQPIGGVSLESGVVSFFGKAQDLGEVEVPLVVIIVNKVTNSITTQLAELILSDNFREQTVFNARDRLMSRLLAAENIDINYRLLLALSLSGDCAEMTSISWELSREKYQDAPPGSIVSEQAVQLKAQRAILKEKKHKLDLQTLDYLTGLGLTPVPDPKCDDIWAYTKDASFQLAKSMLDNASRFRSEFPELTDDEWSQTLELVMKKLLPENMVVSDWTEAYQILAAFLLRNTFSQTAHGAMSAGFGSHNDWTLNKETEGGFALEGRGGLEENIDLIRMTVVRFAAAIPYVQGLCFYFLLISYPFFCLTMIFPQRIGSLVTWASLWLWLYSWEVGFAIVSIIKEILWQSLPHVGDAVLSAQDDTVSRLSDVNWSDPASMFAVLTANSPEQHFQTYYGLIATLTLAVPVITGYCFQAASQIADIIQRAWTPGGGRGK